MFKADKGYGFIKPEDGSANVYVHISAIPPEEVENFAVGKTVTYDIHTEGNKVSAINIVLAGE